MHDRTDEIRWRVAAAERDELRAAGDLMQSALSRVLEFMRSAASDGPPPYEVRMAMHEGGDGVAKWTESRSTNWPNVIRAQLDAEAVASEGKRP